MTHMRGARSVEASEIITLAGVFVGGILAGAIGYLRKAPASQQQPVLQGIGMELGNKEQSERLIEQVKRIADGMDILSDKRTDEFQDMHKALLERLDAQERREEQEEQRPRKPLPRPR